MGGQVNESRFHMWRAIFAMAHADGVVTPEETEFLSEYMTSVPFSDRQKAVLMEDMKHPQDIGDMFSLVADPSDRSQFFFFARMLVWSDGDLAAQEQLILDKLKKAHLTGLDMDQVSKSVRESAKLVKADMVQGEKISFSFRESLKRFQDNFGDKE